jgi:4-hydroxybutyrate dehydrogenase/sulfolactaldehyde 3-reductase
MGGGMSMNLVKKGVSVKGYDINREVVDRLVQDGGTAATSPADAAARADVVFTMLPNSPHVEDALFGVNGIVTSLSKTALYVDCSTITPEVTDFLGKRMKEKGFSMIDAPVGRTSVDAWAGRLVFMVGGEESDLERVRPLLEKMGDAVFHCGPLGAGIRAKIVNNYMTTVLNVVTAETLVLAESYGLDLNKAIEVMRGTPAGRTHLLTTYPGKVLKGDVTPAFMIDLADKDLGIALESASRSRLPLPAGAAARQMYSIASAQGRGREDWTAMLLTYRDLAKK